ncbi:MAG: PAS domain S-box protein [Nitrosomonadales bacterium]|nr:PAS domain S-box protein [Nitrosomonadales bacterium]
MDKELRILLLEDTLSDAELEQHELRKAGIAFIAKRVETRESFVEALKTFQPDIILSDYKLPNFDGMTALKMVRHDYPEVPVIMVTGALADIEAVELLHAGAKDYVLKDRLARLAPAVQRALSAEQGVRARKAAEKALRESEAKFRALVESTSDWIWEINEQGVYTYSSPQVHEMLGYTAVEIIGKTHFDLMPPNEAARLKAAFSSIADGSKPLRLLENANLHKDGRTVFLETSGTPFVDAQGIFRGYRGIDRDITDRKAAEAALRKSEQKFMQLFMEVPVSLGVTNKEGIITYFNQKFTEVFGYTIDDVPTLDEWWLKAYPDETYRHWAQGNWNDAVAKAEKEGADVQSAEYNVTCKNGSERIVIIGGHPFEGGVLAIFNDITERKRAEEALHESGRILERIFNSTYFCVVYLDRDFNFIRVNRAYAKACGYPPEYFPGKNHFQLYPHAENEAIFHKVVQTGEPFTISAKPFEFPEHPEWGVSYWDWTLHPLKASDDSVDALLFVLQDVTERKHSEAELLRLNRTLRALNAGNHALVHGENEKSLLENMCRATTEGGYVLSWVGYALQDEQKSIVPMAVSGEGKAYVEALNLTWDDLPLGRGPTGTAIRTGQTQIAHDFKNDPRMDPWREAATKYGYASSIALPLKENGQVFGTLTIYAAEPGAFGPDQVALLEEMADDLAFGVKALRVRQERDLAMGQDRKHIAQLQDNLEDTVRAIAAIVEMRDPYTAGHQARVADLAAAIGRQMGLPDEQVHAIHLAGVVHDLGKIRVPSEILSKPGKISDIEFSLIKTHAQAGYDILKEINFVWPIAQMVLQHHERLDGSGYPQGLKGDAILLEARILAVADVVEAMYSHRPYRAGLGLESALVEITKRRDIYYDPQTVDACLTLFREKKFSFG